jgi:hypothetical protein
MIALEDRYKIAFIMESGFFMWLVMPFGLKNVPSIFQRVVSLAF